MHWVQRRCRVHTINQSEESVLAFLRPEGLEAAMQRVLTYKGRLHVGRPFFAQVAGIMIDSLAQATPIINEIIDDCRTEAHAPCHKRVIAQPDRVANL